MIARADAHNIPGFRRWACTLNTDAPAEGKRVAAALARHPPGTVEKWVFADEFAGRVRYSIDRAWRGELPRTYFYDADHTVDVVSGRPIDRSGTVTKRFTRAHGNPGQAQQLRRFFAVKHVAASEGVQ